MLQIDGTFHLSAYRGTIVPGQGITLYFTLVILPTAKVGLPVLGPMAMHFLRADSRTINDNMEAIPANVLTKVFSNTINSGNVKLHSHRRPLMACEAGSTKTAQFAGKCTTTTLGPLTYSLTFTTVTLVNLVET